MPNASVLDPPPPRRPRRYLALWFPFLPTDRWKGQAGLGGAPDEAPFALIEKQRGANRLHAAGPSAAALGLCPGLTLADARARVPDLEAAPADRQADERFLAWLGAFCERFSPSVALDPPDGLMLDMTGCSRLFGGEAALHAAVTTRLAAMGLAVQASLAATADAARAFVRHGSSGVTPPGQDDALLRRLPPSALGLDAKTAAALMRAGLKTIGDLADRPSVLLSARFGEDLPRRLARAFGREETPLTPLRPAPDHWVERCFAEPMTHRDGLEAALASLIGDLAQRLEAQGRGGRLFEAVYFRSDGATRRIAVETGAPTREPRAIARLFRERLEALADPLDPGFGFDAVRLAAPVAEALDARQVGLDSREEDGAGVVAFLDRLAVRFGRDRVIRFAAGDTHDPDREARRFSALDVAPRDAGAWPKPEHREPPLRPLRLFRPPQPVEAIAEFPDGPPARFRWRRIWRDVARAEGPERIEPEWWREGGVGTVRDYYRVEDTAGRRYWTFRAGSYDAEEGARWFLHGLFA